MGDFFFFFSSVNPQTAGELTGAIHLRTPAASIFSYFPIWWTGNRCAKNRITGEGSRLSRATFTFATARASIISLWKSERFAYLAIPTCDISRFIYTLYFNGIYSLVFLTSFHNQFYSLIRFQLMEEKYFLKMNFQLKKKRRLMIILY